MFTNLPSIAVSAAQKFKRSASAVADANQGGLPILKLGQQGKEYEGQWVYGVDNIPLGDRLIAINPATMREGLVCWKNANPIDRAMVPIGEPRPLESELKDHGPYKRTSDGWMDTVGFNCVIADEPTIEMTCEGTAKGFHEAWAQIAEMIGNQLEVQPEFFIPLVKFNSTSYYTKTYDKTIFKAQLAVMDWADKEGRKLSQTAVLTDETADEEDPEGIFG